MKNMVPYYFYHKRNLWLLVLATTAFAELFILIFQPFESRSWAIDDLQYLRWVTIVVLVAMAVIGISRLGLYYFSKRHPISYLANGAWILGELTCMTTIYTIFPFLVLPQFVAEHALTFFGVFRQAFLDTMFILLIPYTIVYLIVELREKNNLLSELTKGHEADLLPKMLNFYDEKGELKLSVKPEAVFYIESQDNYVSVHYRIGEKAVSIMIRNSLKKLEPLFLENGLLRCHRSYIVNLRSVQLLRRQDGELKLDFGRNDLPPIPVSKGYASIITETFTNS